MHRVASTAELSLPSYAVGVLSIKVDVVFCFMQRSYKLLQRTASSYFQLTLLLVESK